ncbi:MAG TPA: pyridoxal phosphate-dependent aminotransferase [Thermoanaerobaculia bacterium]|nr:pyridoxal phosphate-dependent aminotransferase [Thermoanaerobaculia bacterium]
MPITPSSRAAAIEISLIRQINALATPLTVNLGIGEPNVEPDREFREMASSVAMSGSWHYTANAGDLTLRRSIADSLLQSIDPHSEICVTAGTEEALFAIMQAFAGPGDEILIPDPGFVSYRTVAEMAGATVKTYKLDPERWTMSLDAVASQVTSATKLVVVNSPSNPLGSVIDTSTLHQLAALASEREFLIVSDEVYSELYYDERPPSMLGRGPNVIVVNGLSKSHSMTGLRLGWVVAAEPLMKPIVKAHQYIATCASAFSQSLAIEVFRNGDWNERWLSGARTQLLRQRDVALSAIEQNLEVALPPPAGAFYAFAPVPSCDTLTLARALATEAGVLTIPGVAFGTMGEGFLRISYASEPAVLVDGIERIGRYLTDHGR